MNANADSELDTFFLLQTSTKVFHGIEDTQTSPYCSLGIVLVSLGIPTVHQETIPQQLGDMPIVALDNLGTHPLIRTHHITPVFRVELRGQFGRVHEVTEHDRQLTAFGFWYTCCAWRRHTLHGLIVLGRRLLGWLSRG